MVGPQCSLTESLKVLGGQYVRPGMQRWTLERRVAKLGGPESQLFLAAPPPSTKTSRKSRRGERGRQARWGSGRLRRPWPGGQVPGRSAP